MRFLFTLVLVLAAAVAAAPAVAKSLALIIGNDSYDEIPPLQKARSDAAGYAEFFRTQGFDVTLRTDLGGRDMVFELATFYDRIAPGDTVVFIYSGHGWSDGAQNYLVPVDARAKGSETLLSQESFPLRNGTNGIIDQIAARGPALTVAVIDACRNNPFLSPAGTRSIGMSRGLAPVSAPRGAFVAFSAGVGQEALDRLSDNDPSPYSVFSRHFLRELSEPQDLQAAFKATQAAVNDEALRIGHAQRPAYYDEVIGSACLTENCAPALYEPDKVPEAAAPPAPPARAISARDEWQDFKDSTSIKALELFADRHAGSPYAALAAERIAILEEEAARAEEEPTARAAEEAARRAQEEAAREAAEEAERIARETPQDYPRPSWCPRAGTATEIAICRDATLARLDIEMASAYHARLATLSGSARDRFRSSQGSWLKLRNGCGSDRDCLEWRYEERIRAIGR